jgi:hypothetical protein
VHEKCKGGLLNEIKRIMAGVFSPLLGDPKMEIPV